MVHSPFNRTENVTQRTTTQQQPGQQPNIQLGQQPQQPGQPPQQQAGQQPQLQPDQQLPRHQPQLHQQLPIQQQQPVHFHSNYKSMGNVHLKPYQGKDQSPVKFWALFIQYCTLLKYSEYETATSFPFFVTDYVQDWYYALDDSIRTNLQRLKTAFFERFQRRNIEYDLHNIKQLESETVDDYLVRIQTQTRDSGVPESLLVGMMVGGLRPDLAAIVMPQLPKTLQQLRSVATIAEKTVAITSTKPIAQLTGQVANMASMEDRIMHMLTDKLNANVAAMSDLHANQQRPQQQQYWSQPPRPQRQYVSQTQQRRQNWASQPQHPARFQRQDQYRQQTPAPNCVGCGRFCFNRQTCPALNAICRYCKLKGHYEQVCRKAKRDNQNRGSNTFQK